MAVAASLSNFARNTRATRTVQPRVTSVRRQPTTRPQPRWPSMWHGAQNIPRTPGARAPARPAAASTAPPAASLAPLPALGATPLPPDASYEQQVAAAAAQRDQTLAALTQQRVGGLQEYGYTETAPGQVQFDANNPFSRAALLRKHYEQSKRGNVTGMAARGQLYSGALQNAQDYAARGFNEGENSLQRALITFLSQNTGQGTQAQNAYQSALSEAESQRVQRAQEQALYQAQLLAAQAAAAPPPAPAADAGGGGGGAPAAAPAAAAAPAVEHEFKRVNGTLYRRIKGSTQQWVPVPGH